MAITHMPSALSSSARFMLNDSASGRSGRPERFAQIAKLISRTMPSTPPASSTSAA
ncbi:hypothetical protein [Actinoplanes sp. SE50/110]|uniref:hypothetical protein n=1 Tax=Actinoplanes sp. (strain ATCC 31044 / CBS 674.73 / SE50/110) TaxID=134676 RepID=UPI001E629C08|nr:hypothetical protein [Actinoplanes sp. SE50/110]